MYAVWSQAIVFFFSSNINDGIVAIIPDDDVYRRQTHELKSIYGIGRNRIFMLDALHSQVDNELIEFVHAHGINRILMSINQNLMCC